MGNHGDPFSRTTSAPPSPTSRAPVRQMPDASWLRSRAASGVLGRDSRSQIPAIQGIGRRTPATCATAHTANSIAVQQGNSGTGSIPQTGPGSDRALRCPGFIPGRAARRDPGKESLPGTPAAASIRRPRQRRVSWSGRWWSSASAAPSRRPRRGKRPPRRRRR